jgi:hypothetical protein
MMADSTHLGGIEMRAVLLMIATTAGLAAAAPALAQDAGRYRLERTQSGFVRMDTETGRMTLCEESEGALACKPAADPRDASADEIERMAARIEALEKRVADLEGGARVGGLPTDEEFERTMGFMERFFRRFIGVVKDLEHEYGPAGPQPDRT